MHHLGPENSEMDYVSAPFHADASVGSQQAQYVGYMERGPPSGQSKYNTIGLLYCGSLYRITRREKFVRYVVRPPHKPQLEL